jgi:hypothetical protein
MPATVQMSGRVSERATLNDKTPFGPIHEASRQCQQPVLPEEQYRGRDVKCSENDNLCCEYGTIVGSER